MLNILDIKNFQIMLGTDVPDYRHAYHWLEYYRHWYGAGVPYPNGKGVYDGEFVIVRFNEDTEAYQCIH